MPGTVHLVGAGPGDPGLLTVRARELLTNAECLVHDYLVSKPILELVPASCVRHYVGKRGGADSVRQDDINALIVRLAASHRNVVRLKGGDPFLFGRGGEEAAALADAGVPFTVVPGITSGIGAPAYAGIPVTHRSSSSAVVFVTGHQKHAPGEPEPDFPWPTVVHVETIVLYMGMHRLAENCASLVAAGRAATTPVAVVQWGTHPVQRTAVGTLADIAAIAKARKLGAPAIVVIGDVVRWREKIRWFDLPAQAPLHGRRILVTRAADQASGLAAALRQRGAEAVLAPLATSEPCPPDELLAALAQPHDWIAFTSANAVRAVWAALRAGGRDARALAGSRLAAVGAATAAALAEHGLHADLAPGGDGGGLGQAMRQAGGASALLPMADNARPELAATLAAAGWRLTTVTAYRTIPCDPGLDLAQEHLDGVALASAATVERFVTWAGPHLPRLVAAGCRFYAIGAHTAAALGTHGLACAGIAATPAVEDLADAIARDLGQARDPGAT